MMKRLLALTLSLLVCASCLAYPDLPDAAVTPGKINPAVTQGNIKQTICVSGWTKTIRPPASYTTNLKVQQLRSGPYKSNLGPAAFEEDHLISLEIGGNPTDQKNLWPQVWNPTDGQGAHKKDHLENTLKSLVCAGSITLKEAQDAISSNWLTAFDKYVTNPPTRFKCQNNYRDCRP